MYLPTSLLLLIFLKVFISCGSSLTNRTSTNSKNQTTCYGNEDGSKCTTFNSTHCKDNIGNYLKICTYSPPEKQLLKHGITDNFTYSKNNESNRLHRNKRQIYSKGQSEMFREPHEALINNNYKTNTPNSLNLAETELLNSGANVQKGPLNLQNTYRNLTKRPEYNYQDSSSKSHIKGFKKVSYLIPEFENEQVEHSGNNNINFQQKLTVNQPKLSSTEPNIPALGRKDVNQPQQPAAYQPNTTAPLQTESVISLQPSNQPNISALLNKKVYQPQSPAAYKPNTPVLRQKEVNPPQPPAVYQPNTSVIPLQPSNQSIPPVYQQSLIQISPYDQKKITNLQSIENVETTEKSLSEELFIKLCMPLKISTIKNKSNILDIEILPSAIKDFIDAETIYLNQSSKDLLNEGQNSKCNETKKKPFSDKKYSLNAIEVGQSESVPHADVIIHDKQDDENYIIPNQYQNYPKYSPASPYIKDWQIEKNYVPITEMYSTLPIENMQMIPQTYYTQGMRIKNVNEIQNPKKHTAVLQPVMNYDLHSVIPPNYSTPTLYPNHELNKLEIPYGNMYERIPKKEGKGMGLFGSNPQRDVQNFYKIYPQFDAKMVHKNSPRNEFQNEKHIKIMMPKANGEENYIKPNWPQFNSKHGAPTPYADGEFGTLEIPNANNNDIKPMKSNREALTRNPQIGESNLYETYPENWVQDPKKHNDDSIPVYGTLASYLNQPYDTLKIPNTNINEIKPKKMNREPLLQNPQIGVPNLYETYPGNWVQDPKKHNDDSIPVYGTLASYLNQPYDTLKIPNTNINEIKPKKMNREPLPQNPQIGVPNLYETYPGNWVQDPKKHKDVSIPVYGTLASYLNQPYDTLKIPNTNINEIKPKKMNREPLPQNPQIGVPNLYETYPGNWVQDSKKHNDDSISVYGSPTSYLNQPYDTSEIPKANINEIKPKKSNREPLTQNPQIGVPNLYGTYPGDWVQNPKKYNDVSIPVYGLPATYLNQPYDTLEIPKANINVIKPKKSNREPLTQNPQIGVPNLYGTYPGDWVQNPKKYNDVSIPVYGLPATYLNQPYNTLEIPNAYSYKRIPKKRIREAITQNPQIGLPNLYETYPRYGVPKSYLNSPNNTLQITNRNIYDRILKGKKPHIDVVIPTKNGDRFIPKFDTPKPYANKYLNTVQIPRGNTNGMLMTRNLQVDMPNRYEVAPTIDPNRQINYDPYDPYDVYQRFEKYDLDNWKKNNQPINNLSNNDPVPKINKTSTNTVTNDTSYPTTPQIDDRQVTNQDPRLPGKAPMETNILINNKYSTNSSNTSTSSSHSNHETNIKFIFPPPSLRQLKDSKPIEISEDTDAVNIQKKNPINKATIENSNSNDKQYDFGLRVSNDSKAVLHNYTNNNHNIDQFTSDSSNYNEKYLPNALKENSPLLKKKSLRPLISGKAYENPLRNDYLTQLSYNNWNKQAQPNVYAYTPYSIHNAIHDNNPTYFDNKITDSNMQYEETQDFSNMYRHAKNPYGMYVIPHPMKFHKYHDKGQFEKQVNNLPWWVDKSDPMNWRKPDLLQERAAIDFIDTPRSRQVKTYFKDKIFKHGVVTYSFSPNADNSSKQMILEAVNKIQRDTCLIFREKQHDDDVNFQFAFLDGECFCATPTDTMRHQTVWMKRSCLQQPGGGLHALLHLLGLPHELRHQNRDKHLIVHPYLVKPEFEWELEKKLPKCASLYMPFDSRSVMNVPSNYGARNNETTISYQKPSEQVINREELSPIDIAKLSILYEDECNMRPQYFLDACN